jgi:hypothetical protein
MEEAGPDEQEHRTERRFDFAAVDLSVLGRPDGRFPNLALSSICNDEPRRERTMKAFKWGTLFHILTTAATMAATVSDVLPGKYKAIAVATAGVLNVAVTNAAKFAPSPSQASVITSQAQTIEALQAARQITQQGRPVQ